MVLIEKMWDIFYLLFQRFFTAAAPYLPLAYTVALIGAVISFFHYLRRRL